MRDATTQLPDRLHLLHLPQPSFDPLPFGHLRQEGTCVPYPAVATAEFLVYYLLSDEELEEVGLSSPGTADLTHELDLRPWMEK